jgi:hypothetical protein
MSDDTAKMTRDQWLILALVRGHVVPDKRGPYTQRKVVRSNWKRAAR